MPAPLKAPVIRARHIGDHDTIAVYVAPTVDANGTVTIELHAGAVEATVVAEAGDANELVKNLTPAQAAPYLDASQAADGTTVYYTAYFHNASGYGPQSNVAKASIGALADETSKALRVNVVKSVAVPTS